MRSRGREWRAGIALLAAVLASPARAAPAPKRGLCAAAGKRATGPQVAVLSAFPAELAPLVAAASVVSTVDADGRRYDVGRLEGVRVVLGLTGIGTVNAARTAATVIERFAPAAIVMSAVAGSPHRIGDVVVPAEWLDQARGLVFGVNPSLVELARRAATALPAPLHTCTRVQPTSVAGGMVCLPFEPMVFFGGRGQSGDTFPGPFPCTPGGDDIFGCDLPVAPSARLASGPAATTVAEAQDMESAAVAGAAAEHYVPFVAVRAVSDGAGDPLGDRGFPTQFFDYYRLAAENAALVTRASLAELGRLPRTARGRRICRLLAQRRWRRAEATLR